MAILLRPFIKYGLMALAILTILFGVYMYGHSKGHDAGYAEAWATQQKTIQAMVDKANAQTEAQNQKINKVEQTSQVTAQQNQAAQAQQQVVVTQVITKYVHDNPKTAQNCGWDTGAVAAINSIIDSGTTTTAGVQNEDHPIVETRHGRVLHLLSAVRMRDRAPSAYAVAHRTTGSASQHRPATADQVSTVAQADSSPLQSGTVFEYHGYLRDDLRYVPSPSDFTVGPDVGRFQSPATAGTSDTATADAEQHSPNV